MSLYIEEEGTYTFPFDEKKTAEKVINAALDYIQCPYETEVSLLLTGDQEIREMNRLHREIDRATDVLSFPMIEYNNPGDFSELDENSDDLFNPESGELMLGDIVISVDHVFLQANEYGHSVMREYAFLIVHSMLHLFGFDHIKEDERAVMEQKQREIMEILQISR